MHVFSLPDMSCGHCIAAVTQALRAIDVKAQVSVDLDTRTARVDSALPRDTLAAALADAGYPPAA